MPLKDNYPLVSIIIPTYNGADKILNVLKALNDQTYKNFEVIVVIDGSTDNTKRKILNTDFDFISLKIFEQANKGRAVVRNTGVEKSEGDLLIFYDDDMRPDVESVCRHIDFHKNYRESICVGHQIEDVDKCYSDIHFYKRYLSEKWTEKYQNGLNKLERHNLFLTAANFSIPKNIFRKLNGFNSKLSDAEDYDLAKRAYALNVNMYFDKNNIAWHDELITAKRYIERRRDYTAAHNKLKQLNNKKQINEVEIHPIKRLFFMFFSFKIWVKWIDSEKLKWLPKTIRYQIYDFVITALGSVFTTKPL